MNEESWQEREARKICKIISECRKLEVEIPDGMTFGTLKLGDEEVDVYLADVVIYDFGVAEIGNGHIVNARPCLKRKFVFIER